LDATGAVKSLSNRYSNSLVGFLVMIPNLAALLAMILVSRSSDRKLERRYHAAIPLTIGGIALMLPETAASPWSSITLLSFAAMGIYSYMGPFWTMPSEFLTGYSAASGIALINSIANLGGFVGPYAIGAISDKPGSLHGGLAVAGLSLFVSATLVLLVPRKASGGKALIAGKWPATRKLLRRCNWGLSRPGTDEGDKGNNRF
jgi:MFS transporter, ACS family, tartrate transporter